MLYLPHHGGLAHLARALAWQARGGRFESDILHKIKTMITVLVVMVFFVYTISIW